MFTVSVEKGGIQGKQTAIAIAKAIRKRSVDCKNTFNCQKPTILEIEGTLLVMIAAGLVEYAVTNKETDNEIVVLELATQQGRYTIQDNGAWDVIPQRYFSN